MFPPPTPGDGAQHPSADTIPTERLDSLATALAPLKGSDARLEAAVRHYVADLKALGLPPERVLGSLKQVVQRVWALAGAGAPIIEDDPRVRLVVHSFIEEYYQGV